MNNPPVGKNTPPPKQLATLVNLAALFILLALMGARPNRKGRMNMTAIPPHFATIEFRACEAKSGVSSDMLYIVTV